MSLVRAYERALLEQIVANAVPAREDGGDITPDWIAVVSRSVLDNRPMLEEHVVELEAAVDRVRYRHSQHEDPILAPGRWCPACGREAPCPTLRDLGVPR